MVKGPKMGGRHIGVFLPVLLVLVFVQSSCRLGKNVPYFRDIPDSLSQAMHVKQADFVEPKIKTNDILGVTIQTIDPQAAAMFNNAGSSSSGGNSPTGSGYLVDANGNIELPLIGKMKVLGLTTIEAKEAIRETAKQYFKDPAVNVRFLNFNITMLGDVARPGTYTVPSERITVLDALGMAGDLSITGKRENVMVMREDGGDRKVVRLNLTRSDMLQSPYYYLRTGDVVYVEPNKAKSGQATVDNSRDRYITYSISAISVILSVISISQALKK
jgi:polysaccharide export outer membrane protein